jgi:hypothetical protein
MRKYSFLLSGTLLFLLFLTAAAQHPAIPLLDKNGDNVMELAREKGEILTLGNTDYYLGAPYSPEQTCGACHDYDAITSAYHFQLGATEVSDDWGREHPGFHYEHLLSPGQYGAW